jgi:NAD+ kinase
MKVAVFGNEKEKIIHLVGQCGFELNDDSPDFVISYGGDGTVMRSETEFPGIPKVILKNSSVCKLCSVYGNEEVLRKVSRGQYKIQNFWKLKVLLNEKEKNALNDITIHNIDPRHAMRYKFSINGKNSGHEIIGDGVVVSTPFGSTGYYRSITDSFFEVGIGLAFNNSTEQSDHMVLSEDSEIEILITRGPANIYADNQSEVLTIEEGKITTIKKSDKFAKIIRVQ